MGCEPALPRPPDDLAPRSGLLVELEQNAVRYEMPVARPTGKFVVIVRLYDNGDAGLSVRGV